MRRQPLTGWRAGTSILGVAAVVGLLSMLVITTAAWIVGTEHTALSALTGAVVVFVVLLVGILGISVVLAGDANLSMAGAAIVYIGQIVLIVAALVALRGQDWMQGRAFAIGAIVQVIVMQVAQVVGYSRGRHIVTAQLPAEAVGEDR
ncbi:MAG: hypothetical protein Q4G67_09705 [Actinomycetia bacterium]|nr:hypothetical protein [Actinomycetes bacterium]